MGLLPGKPGGRHAQRFGAGNQIGLMGFEEREHRIVERRVSDPRAQVRRLEPGQRKQTPGPGVVRKDPGQRRKRQRCLVMGVCLCLEHRLEIVSGKFSGKAGVAKRVLVVEDNELNLKLFCDLLRAHDYEAEGVRDAREAINRATLFAPDIIIMDIQMPHISGLELIEAIRRDVILRRIPVMAVTAYAGKGDEDRIREAGADAYVAKPISLMKFIGVVKELAGLADSRALV